MEVRIKKLTDNAQVPQRAHESDAGLDLVATSMKVDENGNVVYGTGLAVEIPKGFVGLLFPRSSIAKKDIILTNSVGVIDSGYRGEVMFKFRPSVQCINPLKLLWAILTKRPIKAETYSVHTQVNEYKVGERIGQMIIIPYPNVEFVESEELTETERGCGGYGSSGV